LASEPDAEALKSEKKTAIIIAYFGRFDFRLFTVISCHHETEYRWVIDSRYGRIQRVVL